MSKSLSKAPRFQLKKHLLSKKKFYYFDKLKAETEDKKRLSSADLGSEETLQESFHRFCISKSLKTSEG